MTILLIPPPTDPHGLLTHGRYGARVPMVRIVRGRWAPCWSVRGEALILSDAQGPIPEGMNRAREVLARLDRATYPWFWHAPWRSVTCSGPWRVGHDSDGILYAAHVPEGSPPTWHAVLAFATDPEMSEALALAHILAHRTGSEVVCLP